MCACGNMSRKNPNDAVHRYIMSVIVRSSRLAKQCGAVASGAVTHRKRDWPREFPSSAKHGFDGDGLPRVPALYNRRGTPEVLFKTSEMLTMLISPPDTMCKTAGNQQAHAANPSLSFRAVRDFTGCKGLPDSTKIFYSTWEAPIRMIASPLACIPCIGMLKRTWTAVASAAGSALLGPDFFAIPALHTPRPPLQQAQKTRQVNIGRG